MTSLTLDLPRRFPWPTLLSVGIHGAAVAGLLYASVHHQVFELPASAQPVSVTLVSPADLAPPVVAQPPAAQPEPAAEPTPAPDPPKEAPVAIPKPKPKPKPKPLKKVEQPKRTAQPVEPRPAAPASANERAAPAPQPTAAAKPADSAPVGPRAISRGDPAWPQRALALRIEGDVLVKYDVTADGRVDNVEILSAKPANMFEREVKQAMRKWRYAPGQPGQGLKITIKYRFKGGVSLD